MQTVMTTTAIEPNLPMAGAPFEHDPSLFLSVQDTAQIVGMSWSTLYKWLRRSVLPSDLVPLVEVSGQVCLDLAGAAVVALVVALRDHGMEPGEAVVLVREMKGRADTAVFLDDPGAFPSFVLLRRGQEPEFFSAREAEKMSVMKLLERPASTSFGLINILGVYDKVNTGAKLLRSAGEGDVA